MCSELMCQLYILCFFGEAIPLRILLATCAVLYACVPLWSSVDHFLIQDSELFSSCELEAKPEAYLSAGITVPMRGHLSFLLFPSSSFLPSLSLGKDWDPHVTCAHRLLLADVH